MRIGRHVDHAESVLARFWKRESKASGGFFQELVRYLDQYTGSVTRVCFTTASTAVVHIDEHGERLPDDFVRSIALHLAYKSDAAGIVLKLGIVEALFLR